MSHTVVSRQSWLSRLGKSGTGMLGGVALLILTLMGLVWNEGRAVKTAKDIDEGAASVVPLPSADQIDPQLNGRLVHLVGTATSSENLRDDFFGIEINALKFRRKVEMYQWEEISETTTVNKLGGGTETTTNYRYEKIWSEKSISSSSFKDAAAHGNPKEFPLASKESEAGAVKLGAFRLSSPLSAKLSRFEPVPLPEELPEGHTIQNDFIYRSADPMNPQVGDLRITLRAAMPAEVSVIARQSQAMLEGYMTRRDNQIQLLSYGIHSPESMFASAKSANKTLTWGLRILGLILLFMAGRMILEPLAILADVLPFFGKLSRTGISLISVAVAIPIGLVAIGIAWIAYRPVLGIGILVVAVAIPAGFFLLRRKKIAVKA